MVIKPRLKRERYPMPDFIKESLEKHSLVKKYLERPPYQQNDYIGWITRAKLEITRQKRLNQMLGELKRGGVYMNMEWKTKKQ